MKKKIYNKKKFWSGIVFLLLAAISIPSTITDFNNLDALKNIKHIVIDTFCVLFGLTEIYRSLSSKCTKEDEKNDDERESFINMKSQSSAFKITFFICIAITIISIIGLAITKNIMLVGFFIGIGIVPTIMVIANIGGYIYHNNRN
jgi:amino acid permease